MESSQLCCGINIPPDLDECM